MRAVPRLLILAMLIQVASSARAEFFGIPLPELVGPAPVYGGPPIEVPFDFGQDFEHVENVLLMMQAVVTPLVYQSCGWSGEPKPCEQRVTNVGFFVRLDGPIFESTTTVVDGFGGPFPVQPPTSTQPFPKKQAGVFGRSFGDFSFDHLTDGTGTLRLWWNQIYFLTADSTEGGPRSGTTTSADSIENSIAGSANAFARDQLPTGTIFDAVLIVEATPLPEPVVDCPGRWPGLFHCRDSPPRGMQQLPPCARGRFGPFRARCR